MSKGQTLQDPFLNSLRKDRIPVSIFLVNGIKLQGQIESFDQYVVLLKNTVSQMVYKHAISTVVPARNPRTSGTASVTGQIQGSTSGYQSSTGSGFERSPSERNISNERSNVPNTGGYDDRGFAAGRSSFNRGGFGQDRGFERGGFGQDRGFERGGFGQDRGFETPTDNSGFDHTSTNDDNNG